MVLEFEVSHQIIQRKDKNIPVSGSRNYATAVFSFLTEEWSGVNLFALFDTGETVFNVLIDDGKCLVPWEWLQTAGTKYVSVYGGDLITTNKALVKVFESGYTEDGTAPRPPTPDLYDQLVTRINGKADGIAIVGDRLQLFSGRELIQEIELEVDGGTFEDWGKEHVN